MNYNSVKLSFFILLPTYLVGTYFQLRAVEGIKVKNDLLETAVSTGGLGNNWRDRLFPELLICIIVIAKRYLEICEYSEVMIEKTIVERSKKDLNLFFKNQTDMVIIYSIKDKPPSCCE